MPKVSICIPTYKQTTILKQNLESILSQTFKDYEVIITDDTPNDSIKTFIQPYLKHFEGKLTYVHNSVALGSPENWNAAIRLARGEYIKIVHHDDYFTFPESLGDFVSLLDNSPDAAFAFSSSVVHFINRNERWIHIPNKEDLLKLTTNPYSLFFRNFVGAPSATIFRNFQNMEFDKNLKWIVDFEFYSRILSSNNTFRFTTKELITTVGSDHNITNECIDNKQIEIFEYIYFFNKIPYNQIQFESHFNFFYSLFTKYSIYGVKQIRDCGYKDRIPFLILLVLFKRRLKQLIKNRK